MWCLVASDGVLVQSAGPASTTTTTKVSRKASVRMSPYDSMKRPSRQLKATVSDISSATSAVDDTTPCCVCAKCYDEPPADSWTQCPQCDRSQVVPWQLWTGWYNTLLLLPPIALSPWQQSKLAVKFIALCLTINYHQCSINAIWDDFFSFLFTAFKMLVACYC